MKERTPFLLTTVHRIGSLLLWIITALVSWFLVDVLNSALFGALPNIPLLAITGFISGSLAGIGQWLIMRRVIPVSIIWIPATSIGFVCGVVILRTLPTVLCGSADCESQNVSGITTVWGVAGCISAILQTVVLGHTYKGSVFWLLLTGTGWAVLSIFTQLSLYSTNELVIGIVVSAFMTWCALLLIRSQNRFRKAAQITT